MVFMLLVQLACGQPPEPDPRTRVSVSVSAGRDEEGTQVVEILELCQLQDAATDPLLHNLPLSHCACSSRICISSNSDSGLNFVGADSGSGAGSVLNRPFLGSASGSGSGAGRLLGFLGSGSA